MKRLSDDGSTSLRLSKSRNDFSGLLRCPLGRISMYLTVSDLPTNSCPKIQSAALYAPHSLCVKPLKPREKSCERNDVDLEIESNKSSS